MPTSLGQVLYWTACGIAVLVGLLAALNLLSPLGNMRVGVILALCAFIIWLIGRVALYAFTAK